MDIPPFLYYHFLGQATKRTFIRCSVAYPNNRIDDPNNIAALKATLLLSSDNPERSYSPRPISPAIGAREFRPIFT